MKKISVKTILEILRRKSFLAFLGSACLFGIGGSTAWADRPNDMQTVNSGYQFSDVAPLYGKAVTALDSDAATVSHVDSFIYDTRNKLVVSDSPAAEPAWGYSNPIQLVQGGNWSGVSTASYLSTISDDTPIHSVSYADSMNHSGNLRIANPTAPAASYYQPVAMIPAMPNEDETVPVSPEPPSRSESDYVTRDELNDLLSRRSPELQQIQQQMDGFRKGKYTFTPYGYINVSTSYESERTRNGDYALYSLSPDLDGGGHSGFQIDPKSSRLGLKIEGPDMGWCCRSIKTSALFEVDFQGNINSTRNRPGLMLRRAFVDFTDDNTRLLIGQEWEVISPLVPQSLNYVPGSCAGNLGYRRAQIRLERTRKWNPDFSSIWQFAVCDNIPDDFMPDPGVNKANSGWPMLQGRIAGSFGRNPHADCLPFTVGISGHVGEMTNNYSGLAGVDPMQKYRHETWSANLDLEVPVTTKWKLSGELYTGVNLASSLGGIMQGIDFYTPGVAGYDPRSAKASGGWGNINYKMTKKFQLNAGYCVEDLDNILASSLAGTARDRNQIIFLNGIYNWTENLMTGLEVSQWKTDWHTYNGVTINQLEPGETTRIDFLVRYTF